LIWHLHEIVERPKILQSFLSFLISKADIVIAVSKATQSFWNSSLKNIDAQLLYNGIDTTKYANRQWPTGPITISMIGRVQKWKGQDYLLEIIESFNELSARKNESVKNETHNSLSELTADATMLSQLKVIIAGDAYPGYEYLEDELRDSIREKGLEQQVEYLGYKENIPELFNQLHLLILPSTSPDPLPTVVLEAMAAGKPVVATKQGGAVEMIQENETGIFIPLDNAEEAAIILQNTINDQAKLKSMGEAGLKRVQEHFSQTAFANNWKRILK
jgi:glycosyltransferase involved in cell wall biosynthesis